MIRLKAVIFDYGNVLCEPQRDSDLVAMAAECDLPHDQFTEGYWKWRLDYDRAALSPLEYWARVAPGMAQNGALDRVMKLDNESWARPNARSAKWAGELRKSGLKTAILSNMPLPLREYLDRECHWIPEFDHRTFSCDVLAAKPGPEIYEHCLSGLGVAPSEALFLDDREENVNAARRLGIHALVFTNLAQAQADIEEKFPLPA